jgi:prepilin-type N-terminal cleavage/methylation domain-containing protein
MKKSATAQQGFSLIELLIVVAIISIIAAIAMPYLEQARQATRSASAVSSMRIINSAESSHYATNGRYGTLPELVNARLIIDPSLSVGVKSGYTFDVTTATALDYEAVATPALDPTNSFQHYFVDGSGIIRVEVGVDATVASTPVD